MVKDKDGNLFTKDDEIRKRWSEHFDEVLNRQVPSSVADIDEETECTDNIEVGYITRDEIRNAMHYPGGISTEWLFIHLRNQRLYFPVQGRCGEKRSPKYSTPWPSRESSPGPSS